MNDEWDSSCSFHVGDVSQSGGWQSLVVLEMKRREMRPEKLDGRTKTKGVISAVGGISNCQVSADTV